MAITTGILTGGINNHETTSEEANAIATDFFAEGIVDAVGNTSGVAPMTGGFAVNAQGTPDMTVAVGSGVAYVDGTPSSQNAQTFRVKNSASANVTISANSSGSTKYDWVYISLDSTKLNDPNSAADDVATLTTSRSSSASTDDGTPPTYGYALAVVTVANGATSITNSMIRDVRAQVQVNAGASSGADTWTSLGYTPGTVTYNGNRSYNLTITGADVTNVLSNGMRLKLTRTTTPPTQCTDLESSSSQYWVKTSPTALGLTTTATAMAWVKLESYTGSIQNIVATRSGTTAWTMLRVEANGTVSFYGVAASATTDAIVSSQALPLGRWVHIAASMTINSGGQIYIDGVAVPGTYTNGTTTAFGNTGDLAVGRRPDSAVEYFDGKIAQAAIFSSILSASTIRSYASQTLAGNESTCVACFKFNGDGNDSSSNANNLTAQASATATTTDSPFNSTEYGIITANSFSTDTTLTVQVPEGYAIPTSGGVSAMSYSTQDVPYGFPRSKGKWSLITLSSDSSSLSTGARIPGLDTTVPIGAWTARAKANAQVQRTGGTGVNITFGISTSTSTITLPDSACFDFGTASAQPFGCVIPATAPVSLNMTSATVHYATQTGTYTTCALQTYADIGAFHEFLLDFNYI